MANLIEKVTEPAMLYLAWRWAVGTVQKRPDGLELRYITNDDEFRKLNQGRSLQEAFYLGYQGHAAFSIKRTQHSEGVAEALMRRLLPRSRPDFAEYMKNFRLSSNLTLSDFSLLALTEAKTPNDGFSVVDSLDPNVVSADLMLEIAGYRYYLKDGPLGIGVGTTVDILPEPENPKDPDAVQICFRERKIGNINRLQCQTFLKWLAHRSVSAQIERLNGNADKPRAFIFVRIRQKSQAAA